MSEGGQGRCARQGRADALCNAGKMREARPIIFERKGRAEARGNIGRMRQARQVRNARQAVQMREARQGKSRGMAGQMPDAMQGRCPMQCRADARCKA
jgi:hypothetical protein